MNDVLDEAQFIRDMKTVGVSEKDFDWHLSLYRKTKELHKNGQLAQLDRASVFETAG